MEPTKNEAPAMELPPVPEQPSAAFNGQEQATGTPEKPAAAPEATGQPAVPQLPSIPLPTPPTTSVKQTTDDVSATTQPSSLPAGDDGDLIEKEWVNKAKEIVDRNRDDPYKQSEELTVFKADYMKKRYDKSIKLSD